MIKKIIICIAVFICALQNVTLAAGEKFAVKSDIKAYIDYTPIKSYNIDGYTYVIAEDLRGYGFEVIWNNDNRTLNIFRNSLQTPFYTKELRDSDSAPVYTLYRIYETDIKTFLNGEEVNAFNIGGQTIIQIDEFTRCGNFTWDADKREVVVTTYENELRNLYEQLENKSEITDSAALTGGYSYIGQVNESGLPHGIGLLTKKASAAAGGVGYYKTDEILGCFVNGEPDGKIFLDRTLEAGKIGASIKIKFIGEVDSSQKAERGTTQRENNFGSVAVPYYFLTDYTGAEVFPDTNVYLNGVWFEDNGYRGQTGVIFRSWCQAGTGAQGISYEE